MYNLIFFYRKIYCRYLRMCAKFFSNTWIMLYPLDYSFREYNLMFNNLLLLINFHLNFIFFLNLSTFFFNIINWLDLVWNVQKPLLIPSFAFFIRKYFKYFKLNLIYMKKLVGQKWSNWQLKIKRKNVIVIDVKMILTVKVCHLLMKDGWSINFTREP